MLVQHSTHAVTLAIGHPVLIYKEFFAVRRVDEAVTYTVHRLETQNTECIVLCCHFVNNVRVGVGEIVIRVILLFHRNAQSLRVGIIKEKDSTQNGTFPYSLRADEVNVSVQINIVRIRDIRTIDKDYSTQVSHLRFRRKC